MLFVCRVLFGGQGAISGVFSGAVHADVARAVCAKIGAAKTAWFEELLFLFLKDLEGA